VERGDLVVEVPGGRDVKIEQRQGFGRCARGRYQSSACKSQGEDSCGKERYDGCRSAG